jgi:hypothetical protein
MPREVYCYTFAAVPAEDVEAALLLALWGTESLHGEVQVRLEAVYSFDPTGRIGVIDAGTPVGRDLNRLFLGFLQREFGPDSFRVNRIATPATRRSEEVPA